MRDQAAEYKVLLEDLRHRYKQRYQVNLDDELLYMIIRMNELQVDLKKDIKGLQPVSFRKGLDYFWYGMGKSIGFLIMGIGLMLICLYMLNEQTSQRYQVLEKGKGIKLSNFSASGDTTIYFPVKRGTPVRAMLRK